MRALLRAGLQPGSDDAKGCRYAAQWAAKMMGGAAAQEQRPPNARASGASAHHHQALGPPLPLGDWPGSPDSRRVTCSSFSEDFF